MKNHLGGQILYRGPDPVKNGAKGSLTTVEGLIQKAAEGLRKTAELNSETNPEWAEQVKLFCTQKLETIVQRKFQVGSFFSQMLFLKKKVIFLVNL